MSDLFPLLLYEATLRLFLERADGTRGEQLWWGGCANRLQLPERFEEVLWAGSGDRTRRAYHVDAEYGIEVEQTWLLRRDVPIELEFGRNQHYILEIYFLHKGSFYKLIFSGVTWRTRDTSSRSALEFIQNQTFRAEAVDRSSGTNGTTMDLRAGDESLAAFFREGAFAANEYLLGHYRFSVDVQANSARVIGIGGSAPTVLGLEVDGTQTGVTLTIPAGAGEQTVDVSMTIPIAAGKSIRWKCLSAPGTPASYGAVVMTLV